MLNKKKLKKDNTAEEKNIAEQLSEAITKAEEEKNTADENLIKAMTYNQLSPQEQLSTDIAVHLASST